MSFRSGLLLTSVVALFLSPRLAVAAQDCRVMLADFDRAISSSALDEAKRIETQIGDDPVCGGAYQEVRRKRVKLQLALIDDPKGPFTSDSERERQLIDAAAAADLWRAHEHLATFWARQGKRAEALREYEKAIAALDVLNDANPSERAQLLDATAAIRLIVNDDDEGKKPIAFAATPTRAGGGIGGVFSPSLRGVGLVKIPLPIQFETGSARMTFVGSKAFDEMVRAIEEQKLSSIILIGHADPRGSDDYNMQLSEARVKKVAGELQKRIPDAKISIDWKGEREPIAPSGLPFTPTESELFALDRRVELLLPGQ